MFKNLSVLHPTRKMSHITIPAAYVLQCTKPLAAQRCSVGAHGTDAGALQSAATHWSASHSHHLLVCAYTGFGAEQTYGAIVAANNIRVSRCFPSYKAAD